MLERTKALPIEFVELTFRVPAVKAEAARRAMVPFVAEDDDEAIPWREMYPDFHPGVAVRGLRYREGLTQRALAKLIGVPQRHISEMENRKRPIGKAMAKRLAAALKVGYRVFL